MTKIVFFGLLQSMVARCPKERPGPARRLQTRQIELDVVLQELERAGKVKLTEIKGKLVVGLWDSR